MGRDVDGGEGDYAGDGDYEAFVAAYLDDVALLVFEDAVEHTHALASGKVGVYHLKVAATALDCGAKYFHLSLADGCKLACAWHAERPHDTVIAHLAGKLASTTHKDYARQHRPSTYRLLSRDVVRRVLELTLQGIVRVKSCLMGHSLRLVGHVSAHPKGIPLQGVFVLSHFLILRCLLNWAFIPSPPPGIKVPGVKMTRAAFLSQHPRLRTALHVSLLGEPSRAVVPQMERPSDFFLTHRVNISRKVTLFSHN